MQAIPAIEEAVRTMSIGGVRRVEILGSKPELGYPINKSERFSGQRLTGDYFKCVLVCLLAWRIGACLGLMVSLYSERSWVCPGLRPNVCAAVHMLTAPCMLLNL